MENAIKCSIHPQELCTVLCCTCKALVCKDCVNQFFDGPHASHYLRRPNEFTKDVLSKDSSILEGYISNLKKKDLQFDKQIEEIKKQKEIIAKVVDRLENLQKGSSTFELRDLEKLTPLCHKSLVDLIHKGEIEIPEQIEPEEEPTPDPPELVRSNESAPTSRRQSNAIEAQGVEKVETRTEPRIFVDITGSITGEPVNTREERSSTLTIESVEVKKSPRFNQVGSPYLSLAPHTDTIWSLAMSQKHNVFATASSDKTVKVHSFDIKRLDREFQAPSEVYSITYSKDLNRFLFGCANGIIYSYKDYKQELMLKGHTKQVSMLDIDKNEMLLSGSQDNTIQLWNIAKKKSVFSFKHPDDVNGVSMTDGMFCSGAQDGNTRIFDFKTTKSMGIIYDVSAVTAVKFFEPHILATGMLSGKVKCFDIRQSFGKAIQEYEGHGGEIKSIALCSFDKEFITASVDGTLKTWSRTNNQGEIATLIGHQGAVRAVIANNDDIVSAGDDLTLKCWKL